MVYAHFPWQILWFRKRALGESQTEGLFVFIFYLKKNKSAVQRFWLFHYAFLFLSFFINLPFFLTFNFSLIHLELQLTFPFFISYGSSFNLIKLYFCYPLISTLEKVHRSTSNPFFLLNLCGCLQDTGSQRVTEEDSDSSPPGSFLDAEGRATVRNVTQRFLANNKDLLPMFSEPEQPWKFCAGWSRISLVLW